MAPPTLSAGQSEYPLKLKSLEPNQINQCPPKLPPLREALCPPPPHAPQFPQKSIASRRKELHLPWQLLVLKSFQSGGTYPPLVIYFGADLHHFSN